MRLARVLGAIGRGLISAGVIVLLFVAYQLWGTGIQNQQAQGNLADEAEQAGLEVEATDAETLAALAAQSQDDVAAGRILSDASEAAVSSDDADTPDAESDAGPTAVGEPGATLVTADLTEQERQEILAKLYPEPGEAFARIVIPAINVDQISVEGVSVEDLRKGPGHYRTTPNPGQAGNAAIAGHRTTYGAPFHRVDELQPEDSIFVTTAQGTFHYKVLGFSETGQRGGDLGHFIVSPSDTWVLGQDGDENILTLTACHPKYSARQRIIVQAELVGEPAPTIPRGDATDLGEVTIDSGAADERAAELGEDQVVSDEVAADDDPSVDADGNPITADAAETEDADVTGAESDSDPSDSDAAEGADAEASTTDDDTAQDEAVADPEVEEVAVDTSDEGDAELVSAQSPFGDADDFGEGLNGDSTKVRPAIMWGIAGAAIWMAAWFIGHRLNRKWTLYAVGLAPFALVLWSAFVNIDQALPSY